MKGTYTCFRDPLLDPKKIVVWEEGIPNSKNHEITQYCAQAPYRKCIHYTGVKPVSDFVSDENVELVGLLCFVLLFRKLGYLCVGRRGKFPPSPFSASGSLNI